MAEKRTKSSSSRVNKSRRSFVGAVAVLGWSPLLASPGPPQAKQAGPLAVHDLGLPPDVFADLESFAEPLLREARWLDELPLDDVEPAFAFVPHG